MEKVEIKNINLKIGKKTLTLTVEEAKKLKDVLDSLFGENIIYKEIIKEEGRTTYIPLWPTMQPLKIWYHEAKPEPYYTYPTDIV